MRRKKEIEFCDNHRQKGKVSGNTIFCVLRLRVYSHLPFVLC